MWEIIRFSLLLLFVAASPCLTIFSSGVCPPDLLCRVIQSKCQESCGLEMLLRTKGCILNYSVVFEHIFGHLWLLFSTPFNVQQRMMSVFATVSSSAWRGYVCWNQTSRPSTDLFDASQYSLNTLLPCQEIWALNHLPRFVAACSLWLFFHVRFLAMSHMSIV